MDRELVNDYVGKHLPYRLNSMLSPDLISYRRDQPEFADIKERCYQDSLILEPTFEISIIFARTLLQFLGIGYAQKAASLCQFNSKSTDDVTIKDLFPGRPFVSLSNPIVQEHEANFSAIIRIANKSVAHLTTVFSNDIEHLLLAPGRLAILKLMIENVPGLETSKIWYCTQVK